MTNAGETSPLSPPEPALAKAASFDPVIHAMRAVAILLVILGHAFDPYLKENPGLVAARMVIYSFHIQVFVFLSGYLGKKVMTCPRGEYLSRLARQAGRLLTVYVVCSAIIVPVKLALNDYADRPTDPGSALIDILIYPGDHPMITMWFLYVLFLMQAIFLTLARLGVLRHRGVVEFLCVTAVLVAANEWCRQQTVAVCGLNRLGELALYFYLGYQASRIGPPLRDCIHRWRYVLLALPLTWLLLDSLRQTSCVGIVYALIGIALTWAVATILIRDLPCAWPGLKVIGDDAYAIYAYSYFFQVGARIVLVQKLAWTDPVGLLVPFALGVVGPILLARWVLRRHRLLRGWTLGEWVPAAGK
jgi:hypothetical protein